MRGIFEKGTYAIQDGGFNPAYAGNINLQHLNSIRYQVQPRVCGEYEEDRKRSEIISGSTPRMRGILRRLEWVVIRVRFNPAYAGNIGKVIYQQKYSQVQPRVCGEYRFLNYLSINLSGSTPRMRGIYYEYNGAECEFRFNPAYAGNIHKNLQILYL